MEHEVLAVLELLDVLAVVAARDLGALLRARGDARRAPGGFVLEEVSEPLREAGPGQLRGLRRERVFLEEVLLEALVVTEEAAALEGFRRFQAELLVRLRELVRAEVEVLRAHGALRVLAV